MKTKHAEARAQQRKMPRMIEQLFDLYGEEEHDGRGVITLYPSKGSIRNTERDLGGRPVSQLAEWFDAFKIKSTDGRTIIIGIRTRRHWGK